MKITDTDNKSILPEPGQLKCPEALTGNSHDHGKSLAEQRRIYHFQTNFEYPHCPRRIGRGSRPQCRGQAIPGEGLCYFRKLMIPRRWNEKNAI
jgi:hypothetical protein